MIYLLLIIPHTLAIVGLLWCTFSWNDDGRRADGGSDGPGGIGPDPAPDAPPAGPPAGMPPLPYAGHPRRRLRVGERLRELYPRRPRRGHPHERPVRTPAAPQR